MYDEYEYDYDRIIEDTDDLYDDEDYMEDTEDSDNYSYWDNYYHNITDELVDE